MAKKNGKFGKIAITSGVALMLFSLAVYNYFNQGFLGEVNSEIFGVGFGIAVIGIVALIFKIKIS